MPKQQARCSKFLMSIDAYAQPIQLSYMNQKQFPTTVGGVLTILHSLLFVVFFAAVTRDLVNVSFDISSFNESNVSNETRPNYDFELAKIVPAFSLKSGDSSIGNTKIFEYFGAYFTQNYVDKNDGNKMKTKEYNVTSCNNIFEDIEIMFGENKDYIMCPDMQLDEFIALGGSVDQPNTFWLTIGICEEVNQTTGQQNCKNKQHSEEQLSNTYSTLKLANMLPNGYSYTSNATSQYNLVKFQSHLSANFSTIYDIYINPVTSSFLYNWFWSSLQQSEQNFTETSFISPPNIRPFDTRNLVQYRYELTNTVTQNQWQRPSFMNMIGELGGITALLVFFLGNFVSTFASFAIDNSMVTKIYKTPKSKVQPSQQASTTSINGQDSEALLENGETSKNYIFERKDYNYNTCQAVIDYIRANICCCFFNKFCCKQSKENSNFKKGQSLLYGEMDIIQLVKMIRYAKFMTLGTLKPIHWQMVHQFDEYTIKDTSSEGSSSDSSEDEKLKDDMDKADDECFFNQIKDKRLSWYLKPENLKQLAQDIEGENFTDDQKTQLGEWLLKLNHLSSLYLFKIEFTPQNGDDQIGLEKLHLLALKQLVGKNWQGEGTIQQALKESEESIELTQRQVFEFMDSNQGFNLMQQLSGPKVI